MIISSHVEFFPNIRIKEACILLELKKGSVAANGATPWCANIAFGTPEQHLKVMLDTGTTHSWLTSEACNTEACNAHNKFYPKNSSSYHPVGDPDWPVKIDFGPWGQLTAILGADKLKLTSEAEIQTMRVYLADHYDGSQFEELVCDGGLSIPAVNPVEPKTGKSSIKSGLYNRFSYTDSDQILEKLSPIIGNYKAASFGFDRDQAIGFCAFGKLDIEGPENTLSVIKSGIYHMLWTVCLQSFVYDNQEILKNVNFILDTGSSRFKGDPAYISQIIDRITESGRLPTVVTDKSQLDHYKKLDLILNGQRYTLTPDNYFLKIENSRGSTEYHLGFHPLDGMENYLLVGSVFLDTVISSFNYDRSTVTLYHITNRGDLK